MQVFKEDQCGLIKWQKDLGRTKIVKRRLAQALVDIIQYSLPLPLLADHLEILKGYKMSEKKLDPDRLLTL